MKKETTKCYFKHYSQVSRITSEPEYWDNGRESTKIPVELLTFTKGEFYISLKQAPSALLLKGCGNKHLTKSILRELRPTMRCKFERSKDKGKTFEPYELSEESLDIDESSDVLSDQEEIPIKENKPDYASTKYNWITDSYYKENEYLLEPIRKRDEIMFRR